MNPVASLTRVFPTDATTLFAALEARERWWGEGAPGHIVKRVEDQQLTVAIDVSGEPTRAMLVLSPGGPSPAEGVQLQVLHTRFANAADRDAHAALWEQRLDRLGRLLG